MFSNERGWLLIYQKIYISFPTIQHLVGLSYCKETIWAMLGHSHLLSEQKYLMADHNAKWGLKLFLVYTFFYGLFVLTNAISPEVMEWTPFAGINLAVLSGFGLIVLAFLMAMFYGFVAGNNDQEDAS